MASSNGRHETKSTLTMSVSSSPDVAPMSTSESTSLPGENASMWELVRAMPIPLSWSSSPSSANQPGRGTGESTVYSQPWSCSPLHAFAAACRAAAPVLRGITGGCSPEPGIGNVGDSMVLRSSPKFRSA